MPNSTTKDGGIERRKFGRFAIPDWLCLQAKIEEKPLKILDLSYGGMRLKQELQLEEIFNLNIDFMDLQFSIQGICKSSLHSVEESGLGYVTDSLPHTTTFMRKIVPYLELGHDAHQIKSECMVNLNITKGKTFIGLGPTILSVGERAKPSECMMDFIIYEKKGIPFRITIDSTKNIQYYKNLEDKEPCPKSALRKAILFILGVSYEHEIDKG